MCWYAIPVHIIAKRALATNFVGMTLNQFSIRKRIQPDKKLVKSSIPLRTIIGLRSL